MVNQYSIRTFFSAVLGHRTIELKTALPCVVGECGQLTNLAILEADLTRVDFGDQQQPGQIIYPVCKSCLQQGSEQLQDWFNGVLIEAN